MSISNPVMADCPPRKGAESMLRQSGKITALYCRLSRDDELTGRQQQHCKSKGDFK